MPWQKSGGGRQPGALCPALRHSAARPGREPGHCHRRPGESPSRSRTERQCPTRRDTSSPDCGMSQSPAPATGFRGTLPSQRPPGRAGAAAPRTTAEPCAGPSRARRKSPPRPASLLLPLSLLASPARHLRPPRLQGGGSLGLGGTSTSCWPQSPGPCRSSESLARDPKNQVLGVLSLIILATKPE